MTAGADRRGLVLAVVGCLVAAGLPLITLDQLWLQVDVPALAPHPASTEAFAGREVQPDLLVPFAICFAAAALALLPSRRRGRLIMAVALVGAGLLLVGAVCVYLADGGAGAAQYLIRDRLDPTASVAPPEPEMFLLPPGLVLLGGAIAIAVGIFTALRCSRWPVMGIRYERRGAAGSGAADEGTAEEDAERAKQESAPVSEAAMWAAIERGEDPTSISTPATHGDGTPATRDEPAPRPSLE